MSKSRMKTLQADIAEGYYAGETPEAVAYRLNVPRSMVVQEYARLDDIADPGNYGYWSSEDE